MTDAFFAIQVAVQAPPHDPWRERITTLVRQHQRDLSLQDKRGLYGAFANALHEAVDRCALGFWDFVHDGRAEFDEWIAGIEDDATQPWVPDPTGARMDHVLVSALLLLPNGGAAADLAAERCDLPEATWQSRATWRHLFATVAMLPFASVRSDAIYITPGGDRLGFALRELQGEGYEYLVPVQ